MSLTKLETNLNIIKSLPNKPTLEADELKKKFDEASNLIKEYINDTLLEEIEKSIKDSKIKIEDSLTSDDTNKALSAKQGKELKEITDKKQNKILVGTDLPTGGENGDIYIQYFE